MYVFQSCFVDSRQKIRVDSIQFHYLDVCDYYCQLPLCNVRDHTNQVSPLTHSMNCCFSQISYQEVCSSVYFFNNVHSFVYTRQTDLVESRKRYTSYAVPHTLHHYSFEILKRFMFDEMT